MKKIMLIAAAAAGLAFAATTGSAFAQYNPSEAFISQVGNGHNAANIQVGQDAGQTSAVSSGDPSTAVIVQSQAPGGTNGHIALQVQLDPGNAAYTFQSSTFADDQALTWQDGPGNTAVTVQASTASGSQEEEFTSSIIQTGANNVAVNWQSDVPNSATYTVNPTTPGLTIGSPTTTVSSFGVTVPLLGQWTPSGHPAWVAPL